MDPNQGHLLTPIVAGAPVTIYSVSIPLAMARAGAPANRFNLQGVSNIIRAVPVWVALVPNHPVQLSTDTHLTIIAICRAGDPTTVFANIPNISTLRADWRVLFINATGGQLVGRTRSQAGWNRFTMADTRGLVHTRWIKFEQLVPNEDEEEEENGEDPPPAPAADAAAVHVPEAPAVPIDSAPLVQQILALAPGQRNQALDQVIEQLTNLKV